MTRTLLALAAAVAFAIPASAQVSISGLAGTAYTDDFTDYTGAGFAPTAAAGQLDSDVYAISGFGANVDFGGSATSGDPARGTSAGGASTGGVYAFTTATGASWGVQPGGSDFTPGGFYVRFVNDTGASVQVSDLAYTLYVNNDEERANSFTVAFATSTTAVTDPTALTYTNVSAFDYTSEAASDGNGFVAVPRSGTLTGSTIAAGDEFILAFLGDDVAGGGSRDEFAIDNLSVEFGAVTTVSTSGDAGYRLLSVPGMSMSIDALAAINLVSGAAGYTMGDANCAVNNITNIFTGYTGDPTAQNGGYTAPDAGDTVIPGEGFFWYFFGETPEDGQPSSCNDGTNTSTTMALPLSLSGSGMAPTADATVQTTAANADGFYMLGNPFGVAFDVDGISIDAGTIQAAVQAFNPATGDYDVITGDGSDLTDAGEDDVSIWQGFFVETDATANAPTFTFDDAAALSGVEGDGFVARSAGTVSSIEFFVTDGVRNGSAAIVRFDETATQGWDRFDLSKLSPFDPSSFAQVGPVGQDRDGNLVVKAVESLPGGTVSIPTEYTVPVSFTTSEAAGEFSLTWPTVALPDGWMASLRDVVTGQTVDLATTTSITFTHDASAPSERFELSVAPLFVAGESGPESVSLSAIAPNPTAGTARMTLTTTATEAVTVTVFDALGRRVATVLDDVVAAGASRVVSVPTAALAPGVYVVRVTGASFAETRRLTVTR